jgi:hypothetical protein
LRWSTLTRSQATSLVSRSRSTAVPRGAASMNS